MPWYQVPVRQASDLPLTSFRPNVTVGTLSLAVRLPLLGRARDLHPLDYAHVGRTKKPPQIQTICGGQFFIVTVGSVAIRYKGLTPYSFQGSIFTKFSIVHMMCTKRVRNVFEKVSLF